MPEYLYRIIDGIHGAVIVLLLVFMYRLLLVRRDGPIRVRYLAGVFFLVTGLQSLFYFLFDEALPIASIPVAYISIAVDLIALVAGIGLLLVLIRNRHFYEKRTVYTVCALQGMQWGLYALCALWHFAEWTEAFFLLISGLIWGLIGWIIDTAKPLPAMPEMAEEQPENTFLTELNHVLTENQRFCDENLTREAVCRLMLTNRTTFSQRLNEASGMTFSEYLRELRLKEAARMLRETDMPVDQVAFAVGLRSASGFYRNFLLSYGKTPKQYRIDNRAQ